MEVEIYHTKEKEGDPFSRVINRAIIIKTKVNKETLATLKYEFATGLTYRIISIEGGITTLYINLDDAARSSFARFQYEIINHEAGEAFCNGRGTKP